MISIPIEKKWSSTNSGEVFGTINSCYNINFDEEGYAKISPKSVSIYSNTDDADFENVLAIVRSEGSYFVLTTGSCFLVGSNITTTEIASSPATDINSDAVAWQGSTYVSTADNLSYWNGTSWTNSVKATTANVPHPMAVMGNFSGGHLALAATGNTVLRLDGSHSTIVTLTINSNYRITCLRYYQNNLYIGTNAINGTEAKIFVWNGSGTSAQNEYSVGANWVFALAEYNSGIVAVTSAGQVLRYNGGGFAAIANFPVYHTPYRWSNQGVNTTGQVQRNGMVADGDILYININGGVSRPYTVGSTAYTSNFYLPNQPSGVWCYDPKVGLYCRNLSTTDGISSIAVSSVSDSTLTLASAIKATTGEPIYITNVGSLTGISVNTTYYIIRVSSTTIKLATTPADAQAGTAITIGGTAGSATVKVINYSQYGERWTNGDSGAIGYVELDTLSPNIFPEIFKTNIMWGYENTAGSTYLNILTTASNIGNIVTNKMWSSKTTDVYQKLILKYSGVNQDTDKIILKTRDLDVFGLPSQITNGVFSTANILGSDSPYLGQFVSGYNINLLTGNGSGQSVTATTVSGDEFYLSETLTNVSSTDASNFSVDNFKIKETITNTQKSDKSFSDVSLGESSSWYQIMIELRGWNIKIEELQLFNAIQISE